MILIIGRFQVHSERMAAFQVFAREVIEEERHVEGCVGFDILQDVTRADHFVMMEQWRDQTALNQHVGSDAYRRNETKMNSFMVNDAKWVEYDV